MRSKLSGHKKRLLQFAAIGGGVFVLSNLLLVLFLSVMGLNETLAYVLQAVICVTTNYLLNRKFTWGDRDVSAARSGSLFGLMRVVTIAANSLLFSLLVGVLHVPYLLANIGLVGMMTVFNYVVGHKVVFKASPKERNSSESAESTAAPGRHRRTSQGIAGDYSGVR